MMLYKKFDVIDRRISGLPSYSDANLKSIFKDLKPDNAKGKSKEYVNKVKELLKKEKGISE